MKKNDSGTDVEVEHDTVRLAAIVDRALAERVRNAVDALQGPPLRLRLAVMLREAVQHEVERLEKENNKGKPFPKREGKLPR